MEDFSLRQQAQCDLQRDSEQPLRATEQAGKIGSDLFPASPPELDQFTGRQHSFHAEHMVRRHPILQTVGATRVEGQVPPDRADRLARRIRGKMQSVRLRGAGDVEVDHPWLNHRHALVGIEFEDPVEPVEGDHDTILDRQRSPREARPAAARDERDLEFATPADGGDHLIIVGKVIEMSAREEGDPLLFFGGSYRGLA